MAHWRHINLAAKTPVDHELSHGESISKCVDVSASALQDRAQLVWLRWSIMTDMATSLLYFDRCPNWHTSRTGGCMCGAGCPQPAPMTR